MTEHELLLERVRFSDIIHHIALYGSQSPLLASLYSRLKTPLIGDLVYEATTFRGRSPNLRAIGTLVDRIVPHDLTKSHPLRWTYHNYWYAIKSPAAPEPLNWDNCRFHLVISPEWFETFRKHADKWDGMPPEHDFDCMDKSTWWWLRRAKEQEIRCVEAVRVKYPNVTEADMDEWERNRDAATDAELENNE